MAEVTKATERLKLAESNVQKLNLEAGSPTSPETAGKCFYPQPRRDPMKKVYRQLHRDSNGDLYYKLKNGTEVGVSPDDIRIASTSEIRGKGYTIYDGKIVNFRHHRDV